jgi:hypothetical protein
MFEFCSGGKFVKCDIFYENDVSFIWYFCEMECPEQCSGIRLEIGTQDAKLFVCSCLSFKVFSGRSVHNLL